MELTPAQISALNARNLGVALSANDLLALDPRVLDYSVELQPKAFGTTQTLFAMYIEDEWQLSPRLTATLGLRWDYDSLSAKGGRGGDYDNFAPRFAVNYRPDARSSFRFGAGLFYGKIPYTVISDALQRNTTSSAFLGQLAQLQQKGLIPAGAALAPLAFDGNLSVSPACATVSSCPSPTAVQNLRDTAQVNEARILNPNGYDNPYSLQLSAGYQYQLSDTVTIGLDLIYNRSYDLLRLRDLNAPAPFSPNLAALTEANIALLNLYSSNVTSCLNRAARTPSTISLTTAFIRASSAICRSSQEIRFYSQEPIFYTRDILSNSFSGLWPYRNRIAFWSDINAPLGG